MAPNPFLPPNSAALLSPTGVNVKQEHGGSGCPVMFGELHSPGGDGIISHYYWYNTTQGYVHVH